MILAGVPACLLVQVLGEYAVEAVNAKVEDSRERKGLNTTGVRALVILLAGLLLVQLFYSGLVIALSWFHGT